jgi:hypothetical protein
MKYKKVILLYISILLSLNGFSKLDTVYFHIRGKSVKNDRLMVFHKGAPLCIIGNDSVDYHFAIIIDTDSIKPYADLGISIVKLKTNIFKRNNYKVFLPIHYDPHNKHIHLYHIKSRYIQNRFFLYYLPHEKSHFPEYSREIDKYIIVE